MNRNINRPFNRLISSLRACWALHDNRLMRLAILMMTVLALLKLGDEFRRLVWESGRMGAIDLKLRYFELHAWFAGESLYIKYQQAFYPPASYVILWPLLGLLNFAGARWFWAVTSVAMLAWTAFLLLRESGADKPLERLFVVLMFLSMNATGVAIGNGQLILHFLPFLLTGIILFRRGQGSLREDLIASFFILIAFVKPNVSIPFFWIVLFIPGRFRPALLILSSYMVITLFSVSFQTASLIDLARDWFVRGVEVSGDIAVKLSHSNVHTWLVASGHREWIPPVSFLLLIALGAWVYFHRRKDIWLIMGVTALVSRLWTYHGLYDNVLILLPMITLFRIAKQVPAKNSSDLMAGVLLASMVFVALAPARMHYFWPSPWPMLFDIGNSAVWITVLIFLLIRARETKAVHG